LTNTTARPGEPSGESLADGPGPSASAHADYDARLEHCERTLAEIYALMRLVCDELSIDTSPADKTAPVLRVIQGGLEE
jgi:hypothetical protein